MVKIVTSWMREGIEQGIEQGIRQGELTLLLKQLSHRVGTLTPEVEGRIQALSDAQINELGLAFLDFSSVQDLTNWLDNHLAEERRE